jgi:hypothetical protein
MNLNKLNLAFKVGLLLVVVSWFVFTLYSLIAGHTNYSGRMAWYIALTEVLGSVGLGFRSAGAFIALITVSSYFFFKNIGKLEALMAVKIVLLFEAIYYGVAYIPSAIWGVGPNPFIGSFSRILSMTVANFIPCLFEGLLIPTVLIILYTKLNTSKPKAGAIKWLLIAGTAYILVYWVTNSCNWIYALMLKGTAYVLEPLNMLSFLFTTIGLLALAVYAAYFTKKSIGASSLRELNLNKIGAILTLVGIYFLWTYLSWIIFGSVGGWSVWYAWFLGHNVNIWAMTLPLVGLPLIFSQLIRDKNEEIKK